MCCVYSQTNYYLIPKCKCRVDRIWRTALVATFLQHLVNALFYRWASRLLFGSSPFHSSPFSSQLNNLVFSSFQNALKWQRTILNNVNWFESVGFISFYKMQHNFAEYLQSHYSCASFFCTRPIRSFQLFS